MVKGFKINRGRHYNWFFLFIWNCIRDLFSEPIGFFKYKIGQENWEDFKTRIHFDTDPEALEITRQLNELFKKDERGN